jgi:hypothetical protein
VTEHVDEPRHPGETVAPVDPEHEVARRNVALGLMLFGLFLVLFAGTWVVAFIYLAVD